MFAADADAARASLQDGSNSLFDALKRVFDGNRIYGEIAKVGDAKFGEGSYMEDGIPGANDGGLDANIARAETRAGAIGCAAVEGDADEGEVELGGVGNVREAHEGGDAGETGVGEGVERLGMR